MSVISEAYHGFSTLLNTRREPNKSLKGFETRFSAAVSKFNSISTTTKLPQCITSLLLLSNANIDHSQRVSALSSAAPSGVVFTDQAQNDEFLEVVTYHQVSSIVRQCIKANSTVLSGNNGGTPSAAGGEFKKRPPSIGALKKHPCHQCGKFGHWETAHKEDGTLDANTKSFDTSQEYSAFLNRKFNGPRTGDDKKTITFNMAIGSSHYAPSDLSSENCGLLVDDGAEYSAIGAVELQLYFNTDADTELEDLPNTLRGKTHWQYGQGEHSSLSRKMLGSVILNLKTDSGTIVNIRHVVIEGSSQWVIGRNVTSIVNIIHIGRNAIEIHCDGKPDYISMINKGRLSYISLHSFEIESETESLISFNGLSVSCRPWKEVKPIIDKVHKHICGHATFTDIKLLLQRNEIWNDAIECYVSKTLQNCTSCRATAPPQPNRKVSISSLYKSFNQELCIDHLYLDKVRVFHVMDTVTRYSAGFVVENATMEHSIKAFEACWIGQFWFPESIRADTAFINEEFTTYCNERDIRLCPVPPGRHSKNAVESKHGMLRTIFLKLMNASPEVDKEVLALRAISISNDLYGNDVMSSFEQSKGFTKPINGNAISAIPEDIIDAEQKIAAKRKLALILKSKSVLEQYIKIGDMIEIYKPTGMDKKGYGQHLK